MTTPTTTTINVSAGLKELQDNHINWVNNKIDEIKGISKIETKEDFFKYTSDLDYAKRSLDDVNKKRLIITKPLRDRVDELNTKIKNHLETPLNDIKVKLTKFLTEYNLEQRRLEQERIRLEEIRIKKLQEETLAKLAEQNRLDDQVESNMAETAKQALEMVKADKPIEAQTRFATAMGAQTFTERFVFDEENSSIVEVCKMIAETPSLARFLTWNNVQINKELKPSKDYTPVKIKGIEFKIEYGTRTSK